MGLGRPEWAMALCPPPAVVGVGWGGFSAAVCFCLHCSLLSGKEANEEAALRVVKETESEGEERPSRGETTKQVSISLSCTQCSFLLGTDLLCWCPVPFEDTLEWG